MPVKKQRKPKISKREPKGLFMHKWQLTLNSRARMRERVKPVKWKLIEFLDLGFGEDTSISTYEYLDRKSGKKWLEKNKYVGIELKSTGVLKSKHNLRIIYGRALNAMKKIPAHSVKQIRTKFFFSDYVAKRKVKNFHAIAAEVNKLLQEIRRVLKDNRSEFELVEYGNSIEPIKALIAKAGFRVIEEKKFEWEDLAGDHTASQFLDPVFLDVNPEFDHMIPVRILFVKK